MKDQSVIIDLYRFKGHSKWSAAVSIINSNILNEKQILKLYNLHTLLANFDTILRLTL